MINVAVILCSFLAQLSPQNVWFSPQNIWLLSHNPQSELVVHFESEPRIGIGSAVYARGRVVGTVGRITPTRSTSGGKTAFKVTLKLASPSLKKGSMALVSSAWLSSGDDPETFIELLSPFDSDTPALARDEAISGFTSFEAFWRAKNSPSWIDTSEVQLG